MALYSEKIKKLENQVAADFVKKVLGFVYKGSDAQLCITTFVICFEGL